MRKSPIIRGIRLSRSLDDQLTQAVASRGLANTSFFIRSAIEQALGPHSAIGDVEERIAASLDCLRREVRSQGNALQALVAFLDGLTKTVLTCLPEPTGEAYQAAIARARARYEGFLKSVGANMSGNFGEAMKNLIDQLN
jgi:hypothetical protein